MTECPFELDEIVVFTSYMRREKFISIIRKVHIEYYGCFGILIEKATPEQKKMWYENDNYELIIEEL